MEFKHFVYLSDLISLEFIVRRFIMAKKTAFTKGGAKVNLKKNPFNVKTATHKTKTKAVKINVKKVNSNQIKIE